MSDRQLLKRYSKVELDLHRELYMISLNPTDSDLCRFLLTNRNNVNIILGIVSEDLINSEPGATIVHLCFLHGLVKSFLLLYEMCTAHSMLDALHRLTYSGKFPMQLDTLGRMSVYGLCGSSKLVHMHLDMHRSAIVISLANTPIPYKITFREIFKLVRATCIYGTAEELQLIMLVIDTNWDRNDIHFWSKFKEVCCEIYTLSEIGVNVIAVEDCLGMQELRSTPNNYEMCYKSLCSCQVSQIRNLLAAYMYKLRGDCVHYLGCEILALCKLSYKMSSMEVTRIEVENQLFSELLKVDFTRTRYRYSLVSAIKEMLLVHRTGVLFYAYALILLRMESYKVKKHLLRPLMLYFEGWRPNSLSPSNRSMANAIMDCLFNKIVKVEGQPLIQIFHQESPTFSLEYVCPSMLQSLRLVHDLYIRHHILTTLSNNLSNKTSNMVKRFEISFNRLDYSVFDMNTAHVHIPLSQLHNLLIGNCLDTYCTGLIALENVFGTNGMWYTEGILAHSVSGQHSLERCLGALRIVGDKRGFKLCYRILEVEFWQLFYNMYVDQFAQDLDKLLCLVHMCGDDIFIRPDYLSPSLAECVLRSQLGYHFCHILTPSMGNISHQYRYVEGILMGWMADVSRNSNLYNNAVTFVQTFKSITEKYNGTFVMDSTFCHLMIGALHKMQFFFRRNFSKGTPLRYLSPADRVEFMHRCKAKFTVDPEWMTVPQLDVLKRIDSHASRLITMMHFELMCRRDNPAIDATEAIDVEYAINMLLNSLNSDRRYEVESKQVALIVYALHVVYWVTVAPIQLRQQVFVNVKCPPLCVDLIVDEPTLIYLDSMLYWLIQLSSHLGRHLGCPTLLNTIAGVVIAFMGPRLYTSRIFAYFAYQHIYAQGSIIDATHLTKLIYTVLPLIREWCGAEMETLLPQLTDTTVQKTSNVVDMFDMNLDGMTFNRKQRWSATYDGIRDTRSISNSVMKYGYT